MEPVTLLAVDDKPDNLLVLEALILEHLPQCTILTTTSPREGLALAREHAIDGALLDVQMPGLSGIEMARQLKSDPETSHVHIVLITAHEATSQLKAEGLDAGADDFIAKPIENVEFIAKIRAMLRVRNAETELRALNTRLEQLVEERTTQLRRQHAELDSIFNTAADAMCIITGDCAISRVNDTFCELFRTTADSVVGRRCSEVLRLPMCGTPDCPMLGIMRGEAAIETDIALRIGQSEPIPCIFTAKPFTIVESGTIGIVVSLRDISERKQLELQLREAQKMEAIGQMASGVAHDFNNLLAGIMGYASLLEIKSEPGTFAFDTARAVTTAAQRATTLIKQLLSFARKGTHQKVSVDIDDIICEVIDLLSRTADKNIRLDHQCLSTEDATIQGDATQIQQALLNLAVNACDAMPDGGRLLVTSEVVAIDYDFCRTHVDLTPGRYVKVTVSDTGIGIPKANLHRIFEPFFTTKGPGKGTGLGLAMVYGITKSHGGAITVRSEQGSGTRFGLYFPLVRRADTAPGTEREAEMIQGSGVVLLVDDDEIVREVVARMLGELGYSVVTADNGMSALATYHQRLHEFDIVIMDLIMPEMDGRECFENLRKLNPDVKVLLSTGCGMDERVDAVMASGAQMIIRKPFDISELSAAIRATLVQPA